MQSKSDERGERSLFRAGIYPDRELPRYTNGGSNPTTTAVGTGKAARVLWNLGG